MQTPAVLFQHCVVVDAAVGDGDAVVAAADVAAAVDDVAVAVVVVVAAAAAAAAAAAVVVAVAAVGSRSLQLVVEPVAIVDIVGSHFPWLGDDLRHF